MPWFPEFVGAAALARSLTRAAGEADPVAQYFTALTDGDVRALETVWPGEVVVHDPRAGEVRGHRELRKFVKGNQTWLAERGARIEPVASLRVGERAVVELLAHLSFDGQEVAWPLAVVAESPHDREVVFRTYCSQWPVDGQRHLRPSILKSGDVRPGDVVGRYQDALSAGDADAILQTFAPDGYLREPIGTHFSHRGTAELRSYFAKCFGAGGGVALENCTVTDDGELCAVEYNCVRWGSHDVPPQAGISIYERGPDGLLAAVRSYDDVTPPVD